MLLHNDCVERYREILVPIQGRPASGPLGVVLVAPRRLQIERRPGAGVRAEERDRSGALVGELELSVLKLGALILDRDGALRAAARSRAEALLAPPRSGELAQTGYVELPCGTAWTAEVLIARDGGAPAVLPYQTAMVIGHPDLGQPLALQLVVRSRRASWDAGSELLESLRFTGVDETDDEGLVDLPFTH